VALPVGFEDAHFDQAAQLPLQDWRGYQLRDVPRFLRMHERSRKDSLAGGFRIFRKYLRKMRNSYLRPALRV